MAVYSGTCNALTLISCDDDGSTNGLMPSLTISNRPPGSTLFIRFWSFAGLDDGTFGICATINTPLPPTNQDCPNAIPICQNVYNTAVSYSGEGNILDEIDPLNSCLGAGELNDVWYTFTVQTSGNLDFTITPNTISEDYDWAVYNLTNASCADIATDPSLSVSCNFSADPGATGPTGGSAQTSQDAFGTPFNAVIPVTAGETYVVNVSNFSTTQNGYQIDFGASTANIFDNIPPQLTSLTNTVQCGTSQLSFDFSENILCSTIQNGDFTVTGPGGPYTLSNWTSVGCSGGGVYGQLVTVNVNPPITASGNFQFCLTNASASVTDLCGNVAPPSCLNFSISPILVNTNQTNLTCNGNSTGSVTVAPTTGVSPYTYSWTPNVGTSASIANLAAGTYTATITDANGCTATTSATVTQPTLVSGAINPTQPTCGSTNGSATVVASGGTGPYTYLWSPTGGTGATANNLGSGNFSVTITDSQGCTGSSNINLAAPASPIASISSITNSSCQSPTGNITVAVNGGTGPFTYAWSPSGGTGATASTLQPGSYTCVVTDAAGCSSSATATIGAPVTVIAAITASTPESCPGSLDGTATASGSNGTPAYTYAWSPSGGSAAIATGLGAGSYSVIITDAAGCTSSASVTISSSPAINASINSTPVLCNGSASGSLTVNAGGGTGALSYSWSPSGGSGATASNLTAGTYTVTVTDANGCTLTSSSTLTDPSLLTNSISSLGSICGQSTGSATVVASGGTAPYTYAWNPASTNSATITNLTSGQYSVTITDANNCTSTATVAVTDLPGPVATLSTQVDVNCNGGNNGSATVQVAGGSAPLTYSWSPSGGSAASASALSAGTYDVTVTDANGCTSTTQVTIVEPTLLNTSIATAADLSCNGANDGSISITATGGTPTYSFAWTPASTNTSAITNLAAGSYSVLVTDLNGCTSTIAATIAEPSALIASTSPIDALCNGGNTGSATANVSGGTAGYTYQWSPSGGSTANAGNLAAGNYTVTITDANGCTTTSSATIAEPTLLTAAITGSTDASCFGGNNGSASVNANGGTANYTYLWSPSGGTVSSATNLAAGNYSVVTTDANGCTASSIVTINEPTLLTTNSTTTPVNCNGGTDGTVNAVVSGGTSNYSFNWQPGNILTASASGLSAGIYTVTVTDANGCIASSNIAIIEPTLLSASTSSTPALCFGSSDGTAQANVSGGTAVYTYSWFPSGGTNANATGLTAGNYSVTVTDANGCTSSSTANVTQPVAMSLATSSTPATCGSANGSTTVVASGGASPYTYSWSPTGGTNASATNLTANSYTVIVTDANGCTTSTSESVSNTGGPTIATSLGANVSCNGLNDGSASVAVSAGTAPFNYQWSPSGGNGQNATNLAAGNYSITVTDANGCISNDNISITEPTVLLSQISSTDANCAGIGGSATVIAVGGTTPYTYSWIGSAATTATASSLTGGNYTATVTDGHGCTTTASTTVNQPGGIVTVANATPVSCFGGNNGSASVVANGGSGALSYSWSPSGGSNSSATNLTAGNYSVTVSDVGGCVSTAAVVVTQPLAMNLVTNVTPSACGAANGAAGVVAAGGNAPYQYSWSPSGGTNANASNLNAGNYIVTVTDANSCTSTASALVINTGGPTVTLNASTDASCFGGSTGSASVNATGGNGPYTYSWSPYGGTGAAAANLGAGIYTVNTADANGCITAINITINEPTAITIQSTTTPSACGNPNGTATAQGFGGVGNYSYSWLGYTTTDSTLSNITSGNYSVTITDGNGCSATTGLSVGISNGANAILQSSTDVSCDGGSDGSAVVSASGGSAPYTYSWSPNGGTNASASGLSAGNYVVTVSDANNCSTTVNVVINDGAILVLQTASTPASCNGGLDGSANVVVNGGSSPYSYQWTGTSSTNSTASNLGIGNYTVTVTDANGCAEAEVATVNSATAIALNPVSSDLNCNGDLSGSASVSPVGGTPPYTYQWTGNVSTTDSATNLSGGLYTLIVTDVNGCASIENFNIIEPAAMSLSVSPAITVCIGQNTTLNAIVSGGNQPYVYQWSNGLNTDSISVTPSASTSYTVTVNDANGCLAGTQSIPVTLNPPLSINASGPAGICGGEQVNLSSLATGGHGNYTYSWNNGLFNTSNAIDNPTSDATYTVVVTDDCGTPSATAQVTVIVSPDPIVDFGPGNLRGCTPLTVNFDDRSTTLAGSTYTWTFGDSNNSSTQNPEHTYTAAGSYDVTLEVMNSYGCSSVLVMPDMINVYDSPVASFVSQPTEVTNLDPNVSFTNTTIGADYYTWDFGDGSANVNDENPMHAYTDTGTYLITLITINNAGCIDTVRGYIEVGDAFAIYIPNAFTPNFDDVNDHFNALGIGWADFNMYILDRWGLNLYHSTDREKPWDGTYLGDPCQSDTYVYKIQVHDTKGKLHSFIGHVSLVR
ncbi:MAG: PKD domain-containing protein [Bacteroidetes bacterium]|nr:PKD domain-containing protein [Bacteroidota bacterium]